MKMVANVKLEVFNLVPRVPEAPEIRLCLANW